MLIPIRTDRRLRHTPWVNYALIAANVVIFGLTFQQIEGLNAAYEDMMRSGIRYTDAELRQEFPVKNYFVDPSRPALVQFVTSAFLHNSLMHLAFNMLFLYVFGNSVEDRFGKVGYLAFYLAGAVLSGLGHVFFSSAPALGASGAVAAVTGAFLALFPKSNVLLFYWIVFFIGAFEVSSMLLIGFHIVQDLVFQLIGVPGVAYAAHLAGYAFGFIVGMGLLKAHILPREPYDMLSLLEHRRRRAEFKRLARRESPWEFNAKAAAQEQRGPEKLTPQQQEVMQLRSRIIELLNAHQLGPAAREYQKLLSLDSGQVMSQQAQLDLANQLVAEGDRDAAARAFELFLNAYPGYSDREQVELLLGILYARYLGRKQRAGELLRSALDRLSDPSLKQQARTELDRIA